MALQLPVTLSANQPGVSQPGRVNDAIGFAEWILQGLETRVEPITWFPAIGKEGVSWCCAWVDSVWCCGSSSHWRWDSRWWNLSVCRGADDGGWYECGWRLVAGLGVGRVGIPTRSLQCGCWRRGWLAAEFTSGSTLLKGGLRHWR